jgi:hypothetical protein
VKLPRYDVKEDIEAVLNSGDPKQIQLLLDMMNEATDSQIKMRFDDELEAIRAEGLDPATVTWATIANLPPAQRKGAAIAKEIWNSFATDYAGVMVHHGKTKEQAEMGAKFLKKKFADIKGNKKVIASLKTNLALWYANTEESEQFGQVYETLMSKAETLLSQDEDVINQSV